MGGGSPTTPAGWRQARAREGGAGVDQGGGASRRRPQRPPRRKSGEEGVAERRSSTRAFDAEPASAGDTGGPRVQVAPPALFACRRSLRASSAYCSSARTSCSSTRFKPTPVVEEETSYPGGLPVRCCSSAAHCRGSRSWSSGGDGWRLLQFGFAARYYGGYSGDRAAVGLAIDRAGMASKLGTASLQREPCSAASQRLAAVEGDGSIGGEVGIVAESLAVDRPGQTIVIWRINNAEIVAGLATEEARRARVFLVGFIARGARALAAGPAHGIVAPEARRRRASQRLPRNPARASAATRTDHGNVAQREQLAMRDADRGLEHRRARPSRPAACSKCHPGAARALAGGLHADEPAGQRRRQGRRGSGATAAVIGDFDATLAWRYTRRRRLLERAPGATVTRRAASASNDGQAGAACSAYRRCMSLYCSSFADCTWVSAPPARTSSQ